MIKRIISVILMIILLNCYYCFADEELKRFNNLSIYQHNETHYYKISLFTSLKKDKWFLDNIFDNFFTPNYHKNNYYALTTFGKYINENVSVRIQVEKGRNFHTNYYAGMGIDF